MSTHDEHMETMVLDHETRLQRLETGKAVQAEIVERLEVALKELQKIVKEALDEAKKMFVSKDEIESMKTEAKWEKRFWMVALGLGSPIALFIILGIIGAAINFKT